MGSDGICPHYGWALLKPEVNEKEDGGEIIPESLATSGPIHAKKGKPVLSQGGEIEAQGAVPFSRLHEKATQSDVIEHRQKNAGMMGTLVGVLFGLCAVVAFFMFSSQQEFIADKESSMTSAGLNKDTDRAVRTREDVVKFIDEFSGVDDVDELLEVIRFPGLLEPLVRKWSEAYGVDFSYMKGLSVLNYSEVSRFDRRFGVVTMGRAGEGQLGVVFVEIADDGEMRIDWEVLVGAAERSWREFSKTRPGDAVPLWVSIHRTSIIGMPLPEGEDPAQWMALKVMGPISGASGSAQLTLVKKGDAFGDYIENSIPRDTEAPNGKVMAVTAHFTDGLSAMLMIDELRFPGRLRSPTDDQVFALTSWQ